jgi:excinuclease ABC subunit A
MPSTPKTSQQNAVRNADSKTDGQLDGQPSRRQITVTGARSNNLKDIDLTIEHGQWVAFCGLSGSGKSSLALDTLYAEGQRRYVQCLSPKTRQFVRQMAKPEADSIFGVPPSIAIVPSVVSKSKETVASATEIAHLLSEVFAHHAVAVCPKCQRITRPQTKSAMAAQIFSWPEGTRVQICYRLPIDSDVVVVLKQAMGAGFVRAIVGVGGDAKSVEIAQLDLSAVGAGGVWVVADRVVAGKTDLQRIYESLELAMHFGKGTALVLVAGEGDEGQPMITVDGNAWHQFTFTRSLVCASCEHPFAKPDQRLFQRQHPAGACKPCGGSGGKKTLPCVDCNGSGFGPRVNEFFFAEHTIADWFGMTVDQAALQLAELNHQEGHSGDDGQDGHGGQGGAWSVLQMIAARLSFLQSTGLGYLRLNRPVATLSSGERQRVKLTSVLGSTLINMLYVLDEPAMGLHPVEVAMLNRSIGQLHRKGNTVLVVDHNPEVIMAADRVIEIGPGAGAEGGAIVFDGTPQAMLEEGVSLTGEYIGRRRGISCRSDQRRRKRGAIRVAQASTHNLKDVSVEFPLGGLCVLTGVSGSGKSSLLIDCVYRALQAPKDESLLAEVGLKGIHGDELVDEVVLIDGLPIGRTGRSNPVTYVKAFDDIRKAFAETVDARTHNVTAGQFSFNVAGGRCDKCNGEGVQTFDMQFLADIHVKCEQCMGTRYRDEVLNVRYRDLDIAQVLALTVREAFLFFRGQPRVQNKLKALIDVGLEYVPLGQPATTLSSGEAQRLKLASYLNKSKGKRILFVMDEPTTGLHGQDVTRLLDCFDSLITAGHSLVVIEHNLQLIKNADFVVDLGPGAGQAGGHVVVAGTPEDVAACEDSVTGRFLKDVLT